jgi:hypothetical protein
MVVQVASTLILHTLVETRIVDARLCPSLVEGGGSKLCFGDENPDVDLWLASSSLPHMRRFLLVVPALYDRDSGSLVQVLS